MADIIQLLPDAIANQIAAGEVIQRPASVVKELMENAIDAGSTKVQLIIKDAGKSLIQVTDNGKGMSDTDARMSFERHATSKIKKAEDLFSISTKGFRGEALASIAAVAQVEMETRLADNDYGSKIIIEASEVHSQEICSMEVGTKLSVKNLFFNIPARRKFLKSDPVELKHILDEFKRIAIAHPEIKFVLYNNGKELFHLVPGNLKKRILGIFGKAYESKIIKIDEETEMLDISGFVGKPEASKKGSGDQYLIVNKRFIKSAYLNHAIRNAFQELIPKENYPFYVIQLDIDPASIDINVHPTKQEIKFQEERIIYNFLKAGVKHALGQFYVVPAIDFENASSPYTRDLGYKPERSFSGQSNARIDFKANQAKVKNWEKLFEGVAAFSVEAEPEAEETKKLIEDDFSMRPYQLHKQFIICHTRDGMLIVDQQYAHERILYESSLATDQDKNFAVQKLLFPENIELETSDVHMMNEILEELKRLGFDIAHFGDNHFVLHGVPVIAGEDQNGKALILDFIRQFKEELDTNLGLQERVAKVYAKSLTIKRGAVLTNEEMEDLLARLFSCTTPYVNPDGKKCFIEYNLEDLQSQFRNFS